MYVSTKKYTFLQECIMPLEDYIIHVFCLIDDFYKTVQHEHKIRKSGFVALLKDSELISNMRNFIYPEHQSKLDLCWIYKGINKVIKTTTTRKRVHILGTLFYSSNELTII